MTYLITESVSEFCCNSTLHFADLLIFAVSHTTSNCSDTVLTQSVVSGGIIDSSLLSMSSFKSLPTLLAMSLSLSSRRFRQMEVRHYSK